jgi:hypothetical protein
VYERLQNIDRRIIYVLLVLVIALAMFKPLGLPVKVSRDTKTVYQAFDSLPAGSVVWIGCEYSPASLPELNPMIIAVVKQLFKKNIKIVAFGMWNQGPALFQTTVDPIAKEFGKKYGEDWINLGYKGGQRASLKLTSTSIKSGTAGVDHFGKPLDDYPISKLIPSFTKEYFKFIVVFASGDPGPIDYLNFISQPNGIPMTVGAVSVSVPNEMPYVQSGQYTGIIAGMRGAAEYEVLAKLPGKAASGMDAQSLAALLLTLFIIAGNVGYLMSRKSS